MKSIEIHTEKTVRRQPTDLDGVSITDLQAFVNENLDKLAEPRAQIGYYEGVSNEFSEGPPQTREDWEELATIWPMNQLRHWGYDPNKDYPSRDAQ